MYKYLVTIETSELCGFTDAIEIELPELVDIEEYDWMSHPDVEFAAEELRLAEEENRMMGESDEDGEYDEDEDPADIFGTPSFVTLVSVERFENDEIVQAIIHLGGFTCGETIIDHSLDNIKELIMTNSGIKL